MNKKINTIGFILLFFFLICAVSAADNNNETITMQPDPDQDIYQAIDKTTEPLQAQASKEKLEAGKTAKIIAKIEKFKKKKVNLNAPNLKMHYKDGSKFKVTLKDNNKKAMNKAKIKITINGATYNKVTDKKGTALLTINLKSGTYNVVTTYDGSSNFEKKSVKSTVTVKSTIKCSDFSKYYGNTASYYSTFYDKKGKLLKETNVKFKINSKTYSVKTNKKGVGKLSVDLKPGKYSVSSLNPKTSETITKTITINDLIETKDLTMTDGDNSKFSAKILNCYGKASPNKKVTFKISGKTFTQTTDKNGIASLPIDFEYGKYSITTEYDGLSHTNQITINKVVKHTPFSHIIKIPNYVDVTTPYVFHNSAYAVKTGFDGIIRMPKNELITVQVNEKTGYQFSQAKISGVDSTVIGYKSHLIPFDGSGIKSDFHKENLKGNGIIISTDSNYTTIEYRNSGENDIDMFGVYLDKGLGYSETITYLQNNMIKAKIGYQTYNYDENGLKYNLAKYNGKSVYDFNYKSYEEVIGSEVEKIKFAKTGEPVTFNYFGRAIVGYLSSEDITTKFIVNGLEQLEKTETMTYGLGKKYNNNRAFEILQTYAIINDKVNENILNNWISKNSAYLNKLGVMNVYGMFLADLETAWLADELADQYAKQFNVEWKRGSTATILGGITSDDTYLHILNADMGMTVIANNDNAKMFRLMNSVYLPNLENYVLSPVAERYSDNTTNSLDNIMNSIENNQFNIVQFGEMFYILCENTTTAMVINSTSGVANVILIDNGFAYKGSKVPTTCDCCGVGIIPKDILKDIGNNLNKVKTAGGNIIDNVLNKIHPLTIVTYMVGNVAAGIAGKFASGVGLGLSSSVALMMGIHGAGNYIKTNFVDKKDWHWAYEHVTFTRDGYMQSKKFFNIPKSDGTYDYIEVTINPDGSLNRNDALYVGSGTTKKLTKSETYKYFSEEKWTPYNIPKKYQKYKMP